MNSIAMIMMLLAVVIIWGGLIVSVLRLPKEE
ncbi:MAG: methionine/alanine import family NSS transporter small subunit [Kingella sp. (in: b-proteobacteria)]|jgi:hypothetical protein